MRGDITCAEFSRARRYQTRGGSRRYIRRGGTRRYQTRSPAETFNLLPHIRMGGFRLGVRKLYWGYVMTIFGCRERFETRCHFHAAPGPGTCFGTCPEPALNLQPRNPRTRPNLPQTLLQLKTPELTLFRKKSTFSSSFAASHLSASTSSRDATSQQPYLRI